MPHVVPSEERVRAGKRVPAAFKPDPPLEPRTVRLVSQGLWGVVNEYGTGRRAAVRGFDVCGKTGTAQVIGREARTRLKSEGEPFQDNAWFVGFAPRDLPEIAAAVFVEQGGSGGNQRGARPSGHVPGLFRQAQEEAASRRGPLGADHLFPAFRKGELVFRDRILVFRGREPTRLA